MSDDNDTGNFLTRNWMGLVGLGLFLAIVGYYIFK